MCTLVFKVTSIGRLNSGARCLNTDSGKQAKQAWPGPAKVVAAAEEDPDDVPTHPEEEEEDSEFEA